MATTVTFKFPNLAADTLSAEMLAEISVSELKDRIIDLFDDGGGLASVGQGKFFLANIEDGINARVCYVAACFVLTAFGGDPSATRVLIHLRDVSDQFQIVPSE